MFDFSTWTTWSGVAAIILSVANSALYLRKTFKGEVKPHCFTWLIWGTLMETSAYAMFKADAGFGAVVVAFCGLLSLLTGVIAIFKGHKQFTISDKISLGLASFAILSLLVTDDPIHALILTTTADLLGYYPTFRKVYKDPFNESIFTFVVYIVIGLMTLSAIENLTITTLLYPTAVLLANMSLIVFIALCRLIKKRS